MSRLEANETFIVDAARPMLDLMPRGVRGKKARELTATRGTNGARTAEGNAFDFGARATGDDKK